MKFIKGTTRARLKDLQERKNKLQSQLNSVNEEMDALGDIEPITEKELSTPFRALSIKTINDMAIDCPAVYNWMRANQDCSLNDYVDLLYPAGHISWIEKGDKVNEFE